jgi:hypothetical protein
MTMSLLASIVAGDGSNFIVAMERNRERTER